MNDMLAQHGQFITELRDSNTEPRLSRRSLLILGAIYCFLWRLGWTFCRALKQNNRLARKHDISLEYRNRVFKDPLPIKSKLDNKPDVPRKNQLPHPGNKSHILTNGKAAPYRRKQNSSNSTSEVSAPAAQTSRSGKSNDRALNTPASRTQRSHPDMRFYDNFTPLPWESTQFANARNGRVHSVWRMVPARPNAPAVSQPLNVMPS